MWGTIRVSEHQSSANRQWSRRRASQSNILPGERDGRVPQNTPFNSCGGGAGRGGNMRIYRGGSTYCASHKNWIRNIRFSIMNRPLSQWNSDFATEADVPRYSFCEKHNIFTLPQRALRQQKKHGLQMGWCRRGSSSISWRDPEKLGFSAILWRPNRWKTSTIGLSIIWRSHSQCTTNRVENAILWRWRAPLGLLSEGLSCHRGHRARTAPALLPPPTAPSCARQLTSGVRSAHDDPRMIGPARRLLWRRRVAVADAIYRCG